MGFAPPAVRKGSQGVKKSRNEQKHFTQGRKVAKDAKRTMELYFASLCALASLREIVNYFTPSLPFRPAAHIF
jgi:hypothetical protein